MNEPLNVLIMSSLRHRSPTALQAWLGATTSLSIIVLSTQTRLTEKAGSHDNESVTKHISVEGLMPIIGATIMRVPATATNRGLLFTDTRSACRTKRNAAIPCQRRGGSLANPYARARPCSSCCWAQGLSSFNCCPLPPPMTQDLRTHGTQSRLEGP